MQKSIIIKDLNKYSSKKQAAILQRFFKTGPEEYGEGDIFAGIKVPNIRAVVKKYRGTPLNEVKKLLNSKIHEYRLCALLILVWQFKAGNDQHKHKIYNIYLSHTKHINNWDLVDLSAEHIVGEYLYAQPQDMIYALAETDDLWKRRISVLATFNYIKKGRFDVTIKLAEILIDDEHDLIHKAVGWMLREIGKRDINIEETFLKQYYKNMPRTMLRYAIEKFPEPKRQRYLKGNI